MRVGDDIGFLLKMSDQHYFEIKDADYMGVGERQRERDGHPHATGFHQLVALKALLSNSNWIGLAK